MILYAPAWLRRWRRPLVPLLLACGVLAFAALLLLPRFDQSIVEHMVAITTGVFAWTALIFLMNGDPLPTRVPFEVATVDPAHAVDFDVRYDAPTAVAAQTEFWLRSARELRFGALVVTPILLAFYTAVGLKVAQDATAAAFFAVFAALSVIAPVALYFTGRRAASSRARSFPERHVRVGREGIAVGTAGTEGLAWSNVVRVWESQAHMTLVLNPYMAIQLPRDQVPAAAREIILASTASERPDR